MPGALRTMWWHVDLPETVPQPAAPEPSPEPGAPGESLLEWILPTLAGEAFDSELEPPDTDGSVRRLVRRTMRADPSDL